MDYQKTVPFADAAKVLDALTGVFVQHGFRIGEKSETAVELTGPGMISSRQSPLVGISKTRIHRANGSLSIEAEFDSIRRLLKYMGFLIAGLAVFFMVLFGILFTRQGKPIGRVIIVSLVPLAPWPILIPIIGKFLKRRTSRALDTLVHNMTILMQES